VKKFLVTIVGPTAVGKTRTSIKVASHFSTQVISADARQFYKELNIGTAKPTAGELNAVPHHFIGHLSIHQSYSAGDFEKDALTLIEKLFREHDIIVMTGGSGLFMRAVINGLDRFPDVDIEIRKGLKQLYEEKGINALQEIIRQKDPVYYSTADINNPRRLMRAVEVCLSSGIPYSSLRTNRIQQRNFIPVKIGLHLDREILYERIEARVDSMMEAGLLDEVKALFQYRHLTAMQTLGYRELIDHLLGEISLHEAVKLIKQHTRNYAKRQMTWFRKDKDITWFDHGQDGEIIKFIKKTIQQV